jgi:iron complex outermembrane receptor protein
MNKQFGAISLMQTALLVIGTCAGTPATNQAHAEQTSEAAQLEEIIVTAQKRSENLQNVPIAINAVSAAALQRAGITSTDDLMGVAPAMNISRLALTPIVFIRGVGTQYVQPGQEGSNPIYVDGFYNPSAPGAAFSFNNIERIEVLKGPQGTLFGRNATGGAINVITQDPSATPAFSGSIGYANYQTLETTAYVTGPLGDKLTADLASYYHDQNQGWGTNLTTGQAVNRTEEVAVRSKVQYRPDDATVFTLGGDFSRSRSDYGVAWQQLPGAFASISHETYTGNRYDVHENLQPAGLTRQWGVNLRASHDLNFAELVSMSNYRDVVSNFDYDQDASSVPLVNAIFPSYTKAFTQELQIQSLPSSPVQWIGGAFYLHSKDASATATLSGLAFEAAGLQSELRYGVIQTDSIAGYGQATVPLGASTDITGGLRYTHDKKDFDASQTLTTLDGTSTLLPKRASADWSKLTWRGAISHRFSDQFNVFASVSRGYKSGNFLITNQYNPPIAPETLDAYELGFKSDLFDRRLRLNASAYHYNYQNIQLTQIVSGQSVIFNAAAAKVDGLDVDIAAVPVEHLTITASTSSLFRHEYTQFPNAPGTIVNPPSVGGNTPIVIANDAGADMIHAAAFTASLSTNYEIPTSAGTFAINGTLIHSSGFPWEVDNRVRQSSYNLVNTQMSWQLPNEHYRVRVWGRNIFDKNYLTWFSSSISDSGVWGAPRTFGVAFDWDF